MLKQLHIQNYALFSDCTIEFGKGLNILTGETGAGKSLLVGALGLLLGKRSDANVIFYPDKKCVVEATFESLSPKICKDLSGFEEFDMEGNNILIRRELSANGRTRVFVNDTPISIQALKEVTAILIDLHGQNESQLLLEPIKQLQLLDEYADNFPVIEQFKQQLQIAQKIQTEIKHLEAEEATAKQQFDYYSFLVQELFEANLVADEEENLEQELQILQNAEGIRDALRFSTEELYNQERSAYQILSECLHTLQKVSEFDKTLSDAVEKLTEVKETLKDTTYSLQNLLENVEENPERLAFIEERLSIYFKLKKKYNAKTGAELIQIYEDYSQKLDKYGSLEMMIVELREKLKLENEKLIAIGLHIEEQRRKMIPSLEYRVNQLLKEVGFKDAKFLIVLERNFDKHGSLFIEEKNIRPSNTGINFVSFMIQTNPGLPIGELGTIASGGEVSRVMLAIKTALADKAEFPVLIFDEIDTGISGEVAHKVGNVMQKLCASFQILAITHLPQIAAKGTHQYMIFKESTENTTRSGVRKLNQTERVVEIAKMIGGENPTESALKNAAELMG